MVTAGTYRKEHLLDTGARRDIVLSALFRLSKQYGWQLEAWAVLSNHYHFVGRTAQPATSLQGFIKHLHTETARILNTRDKTPRRRIWFNYWDTKLTFEKSSCSAPLRASKSGQAPRGLGGKHVSLVLCLVV
jgi:putative transposase